MAEPLTDVQAYYVDVINLAVNVGALVAVLVVFTCGFVIAKGLASWN